LVQLRGLRAAARAAESTSADAIAHPAVAKAVVVAVWLAGALVFFRAQWRSGWNLVMGNDGDSRLEVYLNEHWFRVFHGQASWLNPQFFYPVKGLLGWSDAFLLYQVFYSPLRLAGADPFLATQLTMVLLSLVAFASCYALIRRAFGAGQVISMAFAVTFTFSNTLWVHAGAFQMNGIWLDPLIALTGLLAWRAAGRGDRMRAGLLGFGCGALAVLLLYTTYYVGYFSFLALAILIVVALAVFRSGFVLAVVEGVRDRRVAVVSAAAGFGIALWPLLETYIPAQHALPPDRYQIALAYAGRTRDLINIGPGNVVWSSAIHSLLPRVDLGVSTLSFAPTPGLWLAGIGGAIVCAWWLHAGRSLRPAASRAAVVLAIAALVMALVPLHTRYITLWAVIYHLPGAKAMRAIQRAEIVTGFLVLLAAAAAMTEIFAHLSASPARLFSSHRSGRRWLIYPLAGLVALIMVEQLNTSPTSAVDRRVQARLVGSVRPAPPGCRVFFVVDSRNPSMYFFEYQIDAMLLSQKLGLPTINGYTAYNPAGWNLEHPGDPGYQDQVDSWTIQEHVSGGLCQLDLAGMTWSRAGGS
jgi:hypothetical protein